MSTMGIDETMPDGDEDFWPLPTRRRKRLKELKEWNGTTFCANSYLLTLLRALTQYLCLNAVTIQSLSRVKIRELVQEAAASRGVTPLCFSRTILKVLRRVLERTREEDPVVSLLRRGGFRPR